MESFAISRHYHPHPYPPRRCEKIGEMGIFSENLPMISRGKFSTFQFFHTFPHGEGVRRVRARRPDRRPHPGGLAHPVQGARRAHARAPARRLPRRDAADPDLEGAAAELQGLLMADRHISPHFLCFFRDFKSFDMRTILNRESSFLPIILNPQKPSIEQ